MRRMKYPGSWLVLMLLCLALCACDRGAPASATAAKHASQDDAQDKDATEAPSQDGPPIELPYIHVEQTEETRVHGVVVNEGSYRSAWSNCQKIPRVAKRPLPDDVVGKLGRTYYQVWYAGQRLAVRIDEWKFIIDSDSLCEFSPVHEARLTLVTPRGAELIDLIRHTRRFDPDMRLQRAWATRQPTKDEDALRAKVQAMLQQQGRGDIMDSPPGAGSEAGQPCRRVRNIGINEEACLWSGGDAWGFGDVGSFAAAPGYGAVDLAAYRLSLRAEPLDHGDGIYLTTQRMSVGQPFDEHVFDPPSGLTDAK